MNNDNDVDVVEIQDSDEFPAMNRNDTQ